MTTLHGNEPDHGSPHVAVIVPVYNDPEGIRTTLESLVGLHYSPTALDIIAVDNGSTDHTGDVVREFAGDYDNVGLVVEDEVKGSYAARNAGIREARGEVLAFLDADMSVEEAWLTNAVDEMTTDGADYLGCDIELELPDPQTLAARYDAHTGFPVEEYIERQRFAPTCSLFVRREVIEDVGLFDPRLASGGDKEFGNRVSDAGYRMTFTAETTAVHPARSSIRDLVLKDVRVGRGHAQLQRYYPDRYGRPGIPPRPSGIKRPRPDLGPRDRVSFAALSKALTAARAIGYFAELADPTDTGADRDVDEPPRPG